MKKLLYLLISFILFSISCNKSKSDPAEIEPVEIDNWTNVIKNGDIHAIAEDGKGNIWICNGTSGIAILEESNWSYLTENDRLNSNVVRSLCKDNNERLWIGTNEGINYYENGILSKYEPNLADLKVTSIIQNLNNDLWFATFHGIDRFDGNNWVHYGVENGIYDEWIEMVVSDKNGNIWISTNNGISSYDGTSWKNYRSLFIYYGSGVDSEYIPGIMVDSKNNIWAITWGGGVLKYNGGNWQHFTTNDGLASDFGRAIIEDNEGRIIVGTTAGVSTYNGESWSNKSLGNQIRCLFKDSKGNIWAGTKENGAYKYSK